MKRIKVKLIGKGVHGDSYRVNLPTYRIDYKRDTNGNPMGVNVDEGFPEDSIDYVNKECYVMVPDDETKEVQGKTKLDQKKIREKYKKNWSKFIASKVEL